MPKTATKPPPADNPLRALRGAAQEAQPSSPVLAGDPNNRNGSMRRPPGLPEGCPVQALGYKGDVYFFRTADGGFKAIRDKDFTQNKMLSLYCGSDDYLEATWPRVGTKNTVTGLDTVRCYADHMAECHKIGPWDPANRMRGTGGWREPDGTLVLHCGTVLFAKAPTGGEETREPGSMARGGEDRRRFVYAKAEAEPQPWRDRVDAKAMAPLLKAFRTFNWKRGEADAALLLGWCVCAIMGGALKWRPLMWVTGDKGTGKSTLHEIIEHLMGGTLVHASDTSAAGIHQALKFSSRPVALDEMEAQEDNRKNQMVIQLARQAASGGLVLRGGQDHTGVEFVARSCFLFSSILKPPLLSQDVSRLAVLELDLWQGAAHGLDADALHTLGRKLRRRILDAWPKWEERLERWRQGMKRAGHSDRTADQFGALLAGADLALADKLPHADNVDEDIARFGLAHLAEQADDLADWRKMLDHVTTAPLDVQRNGRRVNAAQLLEMQMGRIEITGDLVAAQEAAARDLETIGLKALKSDGAGALGGGWWLAIANSHQGLARVFETPTRTHWAARSGTVGVWVQAARRVPGAVWADQILRFNGVRMRVTCVPMAQVLPDGC